MSSVKTFLTWAVALTFAFVAGMMLSDYRHNQERRQSQRIGQVLEESAKNVSVYTYPQETEEGCGISLRYSSEVLAKKAAGYPLSPEEADLIFDYMMQESGYGIAVTRFYENDGGMGKGSRRIWETADYGETWNVLSAQIYSIGPHNFTYMDEVFIEAAFSTTAEAGYFHISEDRGHRFCSIPYKEVFDYDGVAYAEKLAEDAARKTITYRWVDLYTHELVSVVTYDLKMNVLYEEKALSHSGNNITRAS